jgi:pancreatic triacylglycerol lipase
MFSLLNLTFIINILICFVYGKQICYDGYGCFIDTTPFGGTVQRPFSFLPAEPNKIATSFTLYNR